MRTTLLFAAAVAAQFPSIASADEPQKVLIEVPYGDLDLTLPAGEEIFLKRMKRLIKAACVMEPQSSTQRAKTDWHCVETARRDGLSQLAYHKSKGPALASR